MTSIERVSTVFNFGVPDRIPVMAHNFMLAIKEAGIDHKRFRSDPVAMADSMAAQAKKYGLDGIFLDVDTTMLAAACGADVTYPDNAPAVVKGVQPRSLEQLVEEIPQVDLLKCPRIQIYLEAVKRLSDWGRANDCFIRVTAGQGAFSLACLITGMDEFMVALTDPDCEENVNRLLDATYDVALKMHELCYAQGAHMTGYGNSSEGCSVISPRMFRKFCKARETRLAADLKARGIPTICHICGNVTPILPDLIDTGCKAYELDWLTDVQGIHDQALGKFVLSGNVNPAIFSTGTPEEIYRESKAVCDLYRGQGGLVLCSGCAIGPDTTEANMRAFVQAALDE
ncbi:MAG: uroporphyrinogen decarboxylase family protein [Kiritimatiellae bacterium]|nr:uroporphyrinogen decarboxylase family protein [Kiritimatiellia bacterium]